MVDYAHTLGITVEGELGKLVGEEGDLIVKGPEAAQTDPQEAKEFVERTGVDCLAVSIGTQHGHYIAAPHLNIERLKAIKEVVDVPLVLHGGSGTPLDQVQEAIRCGISKINVDTDIRLAVTRNMKELFRDNPSLRESSSIGEIYRLLEANLSAFDPRVFFPPIMDTVTTGNIPDADVGKIIDCVERGVKEVIGTLIVQFGSYGKAPEVERVSLEQMAARYREKGI